MKLNDSKIHLQASEFARKKHDFDKMEMIFESLYYLCRLYEQNQQAVAILSPEPEDEKSGIEFCFLEPFEPDSEKEDYDLLPVLYELKQHIAYNQVDASKFCGVTERTLQRWVKDSGLKPMKLGKHRIFKEDDLLKLIKRKEAEKISRTKIDFKNLFK